MRKPTGDLISMINARTGNDDRIMTGLGFPNDSICEDQGVGGFCKLS
jgi:hypothetical protein